MEVHALLCVKYIFWRPCKNRLLITIKFAKLCSLKVAFKFQIFIKDSFRNSSGYFSGFSRIFWKSSIFRFSARLGPFLVGFAGWKVAPGQLRTFLKFRFEKFPFPLRDIYGPNCEFSRFFRKFHLGSRYQKKLFFWLQSPKKWSKIIFFSNFFDFSKNMELQLQNGIFTSGIPPILLFHEFFETLRYTFKDIKSLPKKDTTHMTVFVEIIQHV